MSRKRKACPNALTADAAGACERNARPDPIIRCRLAPTIPLISGEVKALDQLLGIEIAKLFEENEK